jgi:hypothetical protein
MKRVFLLYLPQKNECLLICWSKLVNSSQTHENLESSVVWEIRLPLRIAASLSLLWRVLQLEC